MTVSPWSVFEPLLNPPPGRRQTSLSETPFQHILFFGSFVFAALVSIAALMFFTKRRAVLLAGALPFIILVLVIGGASVEIASSGLETSNLFDVARMLGVDVRSIEGLLKELIQVLGGGLFLHYASTLGLIVAGLNLRESEEML